MKWNGRERERERESDLSQKHRYSSRISSTTGPPSTSQVVAMPHVDPTRPSTISYALGDISSNYKMNKQITLLSRSILQLAL